MTLNILSTDGNLPSDLESTYLKTAMMPLQSTHMFIASYKWDSCYIELDSNIKEGNLRHIGMLINDIKVKLPSEITEVTLRQLIELFPDSAGKLRKAFLMKIPLEQVIPDRIAS